MASYKLPKSQVYRIIEDKKGNDFESFQIATLRKLSSIVKTYRREHNLTNKQLAEQCGITTSIMSRVESGYQNITIETISKVLSKIGYTISFDSITEKK